MQELTTIPIYLYEYERMYKILKYVHKNLHVHQINYARIHDYSYIFICAWMDVHYFIVSMCTKIKCTPIKLCKNSHIHLMNLLDIIICDMCDENSQGVFFIVYIYIMSRKSTCTPAQLPIAQTQISDNLNDFQYHVLVHLDHFWFNFLYFCILIVLTFVI